MGRLQVASQYTVKFIKPDNNTRTVGTGIVIESGQILTCAHVVRDVTGSDPRYDDVWHNVSLVFPQTLQGDRIYWARVVACLQRTPPDSPDGYEDDIVLLELIEGKPPIAPENYARLGYGANSFGHSFHSFTYAPVDDYPTSTVTGQIATDALPRNKKRLRINTVQLQTDHIIEPGMSGAGILDKENNHVVGLLTEKYKMSHVWMTDHQVLTFEPFNTYGLQLHTEPYELAPIRQPRPSIALSHTQVELQHWLDGASPPLVEWVGREQLLRDMDADWVAPNVRLTGLIGFGGEGKSSLARYWIHRLLAGGVLPQRLLKEEKTDGDVVDGMFWWAFYDKPDVETFLEVAITWLGGNQLAQGTRSPTERAEIIGESLRRRRYLFVLDGLEVMQIQEGDQYGKIKSTALRNLLEYFAAEGSRSFCLVTSRAPLLDLLPVTAYHHRDVGRLLPKDGRALLQQLGVMNSNADLDTVVQQWDGHALTLSLIGTLATQYGGDARAASAGLQIEPRLDGSQITGHHADQYDQVQRVLQRYDEHLTAEERDFLQYFSVFRTHVSMKLAGNLRVGGLEVETMKAIAIRLSKYRLLRWDGATGTIAMHPLVRSYYLTQLLETVRAIDAHKQAKRYYLEQGEGEPESLTLADLEPLIEAVYHACRAEAYDEAIDIFIYQINQDQEFRLLYLLCAYEIALQVLGDFFPDGDFQRTCFLSEKWQNRYLLQSVGFCLTTLGRLEKAIPVFQKSHDIELDMEDWENASITSTNVANSQIHLGQLADSRQTAKNALEFSRRAESKQQAGGSSWAWAYIGWSAHLLGDMTGANEAFWQAEIMERKINESAQYLSSQIGIYHAEHLRRVGNSIQNPKGINNADYARRITEANLVICRGWPQWLSQCHRILGNLDEDAGDHSHTRDHYTEALHIARLSQDRAVLIEALLARGHWRARWALQIEALTSFGNLSTLVASAHADLDEGLEYAVDGSYRLYECDIRIGLAWAHYHGGNPSSAQQQVHYAANLAREMNYYWGEMDALEIAALL